MAGCATACASIGCGAALTLRGGGTGLNVAVEGVTGVVGRLPVEAVLGRGKKALDGLVTRAGRDGRGPPGLLGADRGANGPAPPSVVVGEDGIWPEAFMSPTTAYELDEPLTSSIELEAVNRPALTPISRSSGPRSRWTGGRAQLGDENDPPTDDARDDVPFARSDDADQPV